MSKANGRIPTFKPRWAKASAKAQRRAYERQPQRQVDKNFYSSRPWLQLRAYKLSLNPVCEECETRGIVTLAKDVHHIKERKDFPDLALELSNLQSLCRPCHNAKRKVQERGQLLPDRRRQGREKA